MIPDENRGLAAEIDQLRRQVQELCQWRDSEIERRRREDSVERIRSGDSIEVVREPGTGVVVIWYDGNPLWLAADEVDDLIDALNRVTGRKA